MAELARNFNFGKDIELIKEIELKRSFWKVLSLCDNNSIPMQWITGFAYGTRIRSSAAGNYVILCVALLRDVKNCTLRLTVSNTTAFGNYTFDSYIFNYPDLGTPIAFNVENGVGKAFVTTAATEGKYVDCVMQNLVKGQLSCKFGNGNANGIYVKNVELIDNDL